MDQFGWGGTQKIAGVKRRKAQAQNKRANSGFNPLIVHANSALHGFSIDKVPTPPTSPLPKRPTRPPPPRTLKLPQPPPPLPGHLRRRNTITLNQ